MQSTSSPLKSGHIGIKDAQCAETYEKTIIFPIFIFWDMVDFVLKILRKFTKILMSFINRIKTEAHRGLQGALFFLFPFFPPFFFVLERRGASKK